MRNRNSDPEYVWRVEVTRTWPSGRSTVLRHGPYLAKGAATSAGNHYTKWFGDESTHHTQIQRSKLIWEDYPE